MNKENILFGVVGLLAGLIIGFVFANNVNQQGTGAARSSAPVTGQNANIPPGHPEIGSMNGGQGGMQPEVQAAIDAAKNAPNDFDAQAKAADMYYQIGRFDEAIKYLQAANKLRPDDRETIVQLGNANFDADKYEEAERWYSSALAKKPDDVNVRTDLGLTFLLRTPPNYDRAIQEFDRSLAVDPNHIQTLQNMVVAYTKKGDAAKANSTIAKIEALEPTNSALQRLKEEAGKISSR
ncbi:MAG: tetratricopeptide repeat protein [Acidobacteria bacterium]|nr:tetratricopeptide repeat protein [Acidobacteriota bacterium]MCW5947947.1 tetratricopeptide repeat protein [Pyrinomonadaceae bacterium]